MSTEVKPPVCIFCGTELTKLEIDPIATNSCWFCIADIMENAGTAEQIPDPAMYGRPNGFEEWNLRKIDANVVKQEVGKDQDEKDQHQETLVFTPEERKEFFIKNGFDLDQRTPVTVLTQRGANDDTYLTFSVRGYIPKPYQAEFLRLMKDVLERFTDIITFGPNNVMSFDRIKSSTSEILFR
jgi:hypothetical protein